MWILTGLYYLFEQGKEKSHLIEVILKTFLTRVQTLNRFQPLSSFNQTQTFCSVIFTI